MRPAVLLVEDDPGFQGLLAQVLEQAGYACSVAGDGVEALRMARESPPDLVLLDLRLPRKDGWEVCEELRREGPVPIIILTSIMSEEEKVRLLRLGADDFLFKPPKVPELLARMEALLRRARLTPRQSDAPRATGLDLDMEHGRVILDGAQVELTPVEWELLRFLARHPGEMVTFETLLELVAGPNYTAQRDYLHVHINTLRSKLQDPAHQPRFIETVRGKGYRFISGSQEKDDSGRLPLR